MPDNQERVDYQVPDPHPALRRLDILVGTWNVKGLDDAMGDDDISGQVVFEWMEGGFFLVQRVNLNDGGYKVQGIELIGYDVQARTCTSHYFDNMGNAFLYTWDIFGDTLTIRGTGFHPGISLSRFDLSGPTAVFRGVFSKDGNRLVGTWEWPGGGYGTSMTRVR